jgi:tight adherence protein B
MSGSIGGLDNGALLLMAGLSIVALGIVYFLTSIPERAERRRLRRRLARLAHNVPQKTADEAGVTVRRDIADSSIETLDKLIKRLLPRPEKLRERLAATGKRISLGEYVLASLVTGGVAFAVLSLIVRVPPIVALLFSFTATIWLPHKATGIMIESRRKRFLELFPEAIELIVRGLKSGVPTSESIKAVGREIPDPLGFEFRSITDAMMLGQTFDALAAASKRINLPEFRFFEISLGIQQETGGNLGETLENLATILRRRKQMKQKIKALSSEATASAYILGSLPFLVFGAMTAINPDYAGILFTDTRGNIVLGVALALIATGVGTMIRMGKFNI